MTTGIRAKIFVALLATFSLIVAAMLAMMQWSFDRGLISYVNTLEAERLERLALELENYHSLTGSWDELSGNFPRWMWMLVLTLPEGEERRMMLDRTERRMARMQKGRGAPPPPPADRAHLFEARVTLLNGAGEPLFGPLQVAEGSLHRPLLVDGSAIGELVLQPSRELSESHQLRFSHDHRLAMLILGGLLLVVSALFSYLFAKRIVLPLQAIAAAIRRLASGNFQEQVSLTGNDELARLGDDVNLLARTLEENESARRRWFADISHELRTPLTILQGEIEALEDGIHEPTPEYLGHLREEVSRFGRLVNDLAELSLADIGALNYRRLPLDPSQLIAEVIDIARSRLREKGLRIRFTPAVAGDHLLGDADRLHQLFSNLLSNSIAYTEPGGEIRIACRLQENRFFILWQDSAPAPPAETLPRLFERLYRGEASRSRKTGGTGLGLAICHSIVSGHNGTIKADISPLGGLALTLTFPCDRSNP